LHIGEIQIQRNQDSAFCAAALEERRIRCSRKPLFGDCCRFKACVAEYPRAFFREILVDFEFQALVSSGRSTVPSRASAAA